jgi:hypothetical protein
MVISRHSGVEHRASTRILHRTLFLASLLISAQVFLTPLASSSTVLHHVFLGLLLPRLPWRLHCRACLAMSLDGFRGLWPSHPHLRFLICKSILRCFVCFHNSLFVIWCGQKILSIFLRHLLIKTRSLAIILFQFSHTDKFTMHLSCWNMSVCLMCPFQTHAAAWEGQEWPEVFSMQPGVPATQVLGKAHCRAQVPQWVSRVQQNILEVQTTQTSPEWSQPSCVWEEVRGTLIRWSNMIHFPSFTPSCYKKPMFAGINAHCAP